jgi:hypothetical protein
MRKLIFIGLSILCATSLFAQTEGTTKAKLTHEQRTEKYVAKMEKVVALDATQKTKVYDLRLEKVKKVAEIRKGDKNDTEAMKNQIKPIVKEYNDGLKEILNDVQMLKWKEHRKTERVKIKANVEKRKAKKNAKSKENPLEDDDYMDSFEEE